MVKKAAQAWPNHLLRQARQERGWSQRVVADRIGCTPGYDDYPLGARQRYPQPLPNSRPECPVFPPEGARQPGDEGSPAARVALTGMLCYTFN